MKTAALFVLFALALLCAPMLVPSAAPQSVSDCGCIVCDCNGCGCNALKPVAASKGDCRCKVCDCGEGCACDTLAH